MLAPPFPCPFPILAYDDAQPNAGSAITVSARISRCFEHEAIACAFDLLRLDGDDLRRLPLSDRKAKLRKLLARARDGIQCVWHVEADGEDSFKAACKLGLEGIVSKRLTAPYTEPLPHQREEEPHLRPLAG